MKDEFDASRSRINCSPSRNFSNTDENFEKEKKKTDDEYHTASRAGVA